MPTRRFKKKYQIVIKCCRILLYAPILSYASCHHAAYANLSTETTYLQVEPKICITPTETNACQTTVVAYWRYYQPINVCLYRDHPVQTLQCWQEQTQGEMAFDINSTQHITLTLQQQTNHEVLLTTQILVMSKRLRIKQLRRKTRHVWSIF